MIINGNALHLPLADNSIQCCVTSPPYYGLRDYGTTQWIGGDLDCDHKDTGSYQRGTSDSHCEDQPSRQNTVKPYIGYCGKCGAIRKDAQLGLEKSPEEYIANMVQVFREVKRVLKPDGACWINIGDSYNAAGRKTQGTRIGYKQGTNRASSTGADNKRGSSDLLKPKDLIGIPWMLAFALRADGWYLRQDIIWAKPNPMPESVRDRCTKSHEYVFLLSKSAKYFYDSDAIKVPIKDTSVARLIQSVGNQTGSDRVPGKTNGNMKAVMFGWNKQCPDAPGIHSGKEWNPKMAGGGSSYKEGHSGYFDKNGKALCGITANKKSVWSITTKGFKEAHFATMPEKLVEPCILAGSKPGDVILDPFSGAATVGLVAERYGRKYVGIELNMDYIGMSKRRLSFNQMKLAA